MNKRSALIAGTWALSCGAAFLAGRTSLKSDPSDAPPESSQQSLSTRSADFRPGHSGATAGTPGSRFRTSSNPGSEEAGLKDAVLALTRMSDPIARAEGFLQLVKDLSPDQFLTVVDTYRSQGINEEHFGEYRILLTAWAQASPLEALTYAKDNTGSPFARQTILATWSKTDPASAIAWARENFDNKGDDKQANPWLVGVIEGLASSDLSQATRLLEELPYSRGRGEALGAIFDEISQLGPDAGKDWVAGLRDEQLKAGAAARLAGILAETDPKGAAEWATGLGTEAMKRSAQSIVEHWVNDDLDAAQSWVDSQPEEIIASAGSAIIEGILKQKDPAAASDWLAAYEGNPAFDDPVRTLVWRSMKETPELAADWIMKLSSERDQERTFHRVIGGWIGSDSERAMEYIQNNPVPESVRRRAEMQLQQDQK
ncbi:hypothetical protein V2O64_06365 [Verrucomicrobiaceae bacterium 227]